MELLLATTLVVKNLGKDWWSGASNEINSWAKSLRLSSPARHPLPKLIFEWGSAEASPATYGRMLSFAFDLLDAIDQKDSNLESKLPELKSESFFETWFELHAASIFRRKGMSTRFIGASPTEKRPDLLIKFGDKYVFGECKMRTGLSPEERFSEQIFKERMRSRLGSVEALLKDASEKVTPEGSPYVVMLGIGEPLSTVSSSLEQKLLRSLIETFLIRNPNITAVVILSEHWFLDGDLVQFQTRIQYIPSLVATHALPEDFYRILIDAKVNTRPNFESLSEYALRH